jgi:hypothetical protein
LLSRWSDCATELGPKERVSIYCLGFVFKVSKLALRPAQPPIQWLSEVFFIRELKRQGYEAKKSPTSNAEIKMCGAKPPPPSAPSCCGAELSTGLTLQ